MAVRQESRQTGISFAALLKAHRKAAGLTQEQLAERAGYSTVYVSMLERGQRLPQPATVDALASALALTPGDRETLERAAVPQPEGTPPEDLLVGRQRELALIERHLKGVGPPMLLLAGEPGIGKTRLLREAGARAESFGLRTLAAGCLRRGGEDPFTPLLQALQSYIQTQSESRLRADLAGCAWLVRLLPELAGGPIEPLPSWTIPPEQERRLMDNAVVRFLANVAGPGGTLLVLDDLQWATTDALDLIRVLAHAPAPVRFIGAYRENETAKHHPLGALLADLAHSGLAAHVRLGPLSHEDAAALLHTLLDQESESEDDLRERVLRQADGVPFFLLSWAHGMRTGALAPEQSGDLPWDLTQSIRQRVSMLPEPARELLGRAALIGRRVPRSLLLALGSEQEEVLLEGLDAACHALLLEEGDGDAYQFTHDIIREVIEVDLGAARRTVLHRQIGEALERQGGFVEALAYHYARSSDAHKATLYLARAGEAAEGQHAHAASEGYYRELVDRLDGLGQTGEAASAREKLGRVLITVARYDDALAILEEAAQTYRRMSDLDGEARATAQIGRAYYLKGMHEEGIERLEALRHRIEDRPEPRAQAELNAALPPLYLARSRYREQLEAAERAAGLARTLADDRILAAAQVWCGCALNQLGDLEQGRRLLEEAIPLAEAVDDLTSLVHALNDLGFLYEIGGEFARSRVYKHRALDIAERVGDPAAIANMTFRCGQNAFLSGDWTEARAHFERSLSLARRADTSSVLAYPLFGLGLLALARGERDAVMRHAEECLAVATQTGDTQMVRAAHSLLAELELQDGQPENAHSRLQALAPGDEGLDLHSILPTLAEACLTLGYADGAQRYLEEGMRKAATSHSRIGLVDLQRVQVLTLIQQRRWDEAAAVLDRALQAAHSMPYPYAEARLLHTAALLHQQMGDQAQAERSLNEAHAAFQRLGAKRLLGAQPVSDCPGIATQ